jgi:hypothetical protein
MPWLEAKVGSKADCAELLECVHDAFQFGGEKVHGSSVQNLRQKCAALRLHADEDVTFALLCIAISRLVAQRATNASVAAQSARAALDFALAELAASPPLFARPFPPFLRLHSAPTATLSLLHYACVHQGTAVALQLFLDAGIRFYFIFFTFVILLIELYFRSGYYV